jgi:serine/threonine protein kinase
MTLLEKLEFELPVWNKVSFTVKDLLINLLKKDPLERLTLDKTINHPWFNSIIKHSL